jgi:hypothetical protein
MIVKTLLPVGCNAKVSELDVPTFIKHNVFWLNVPMDDFLFVTCFNSASNASNKELCNFWLISFVLNQVEPEITTFH